MDGLQTLITFAGAVIGSLVTVVVFLYKQLDKERSGRLSDAKEVNKKLTSPIADIANMTKKIYDGLPDKNRGK